MKKFLSMVGKKNLIIISGIVLIGLAIYLNLSLQDIPANNEDNGHVLETPTELYDDYAKTLGQAALVDNLNVQNVNLATEETPEEDNYFAVSIVNRQRARDESVDLLQSIIETSDTVPEAQAKAFYDLSIIAAEIENEANIETLIKAKGFMDCVAVISGENANVIVKTDGLMPNEIAQIKEIVYEQASILPANVKIIEKN